MVVGVLYEYISSDMEFCSDARIALGKDKPIEADDSKISTRKLENSSPV